MRKEVAIIIFLLILVGAILTISIIFLSYEKNENIKERVYCTEENRDIATCTALASPVCGWFNSQINCIKYPCAQTFGNACDACANENVEYYTEGQCPN